MIPLVGRPLYQKVEMITSRVNAAGDALARSGKLMFIDIGGMLAQWTTAPNGAMYVPFDNFALLELFQDNNFPARSACDLGGGLGGASAVFSLFFDRVAMWEADPMMAQGTRDLWSDAGAPYRDIRINEGDFLSPAADLKKFSFLFFFYPFHTDFKTLMSKKLLDAAKGAVVVSNSFWDNSFESALFPNAAFKPYPIDRTFNPPFYVYERV